MNDVEGFFLDGQRAVYLAGGVVSFDETVALVRAAIVAARENRARELLVDTRELVGFDSPATFQRFLAAVNWAEAANASLRLAMVARAELIDPDKFGVIVAANRGLVSNIFPTEAEARAWLDLPPALGP
jgi:hypothetical protein